MTNTFKTISIAVTIAVCTALPARSQSIVPRDDNTGTIVTPNGNQFDITGGQRSGDGGNLFHSFDRFHVETGQTANFLSVPEINNIFSRVGGGEISTIDGTIAVSGSNANLFLLNPAGIIFGPNASLNVPANFMATTANGIELEGGIFASANAVNWSQLVGEPTAFYFLDSNASSLVNEGNLAVRSGNQIGLIGRTIANSGTVAASGGIVAAIPVSEGNFVRLSVPGNLLSLEIAPVTDGQSLAELLTGGTGNHANQTIVDDRGTVEISGGDIAIELETEEASAIATDLQAETIDSTRSSEDLSSAESQENRDRLFAESATLVQLRDRTTTLLDRGDTATAVSAIDTLYEREYEQYFQRSLKQPGAVLSLTDIRDRLEAINTQTCTKSAILYTFSHRDRLDLVFVTAEQDPLVARVAEADRATLMKTIVEFRREITDRSRLRTKTFLEPAQQLYQWLFAPLEAELEALDIDTIVVVPDTGMRLIPLAALHDGDEFAIEKFGLSIVPSVNLLETQLASAVSEPEVEGEIETEENSSDAATESANPVGEPEAEGEVETEEHLSSDPGENSAETEETEEEDSEDEEDETESCIPQRDRRVLAMGASSFTQLPPLPAVPTELKVAAGNPDDSEIFLNENFTLANLQTQPRSRSADVVHLATHAQFQPGKASNSYIQLWSETLSLDRLYQLGWHDLSLDLLVLSACRTAIGDAGAELGFAGLAVQTGARSALASLWYVSDEGTLALMGGFYEQLREAHTKAEALRQTQIALLEGDIRIKDGELQTPEGALELPAEYENLDELEFVHPYFWGSFVLVGSPW